MNGIHTSATAHGTEQTQVRVAAGGSLLEAFGAIATMALAIVALAGIWSPTMAGIATIVAGAATIMEGGAWSMRRQWSPTAELTETNEGGMGADFVGGIAAVVLGILALLGIATASLIPIAVLVLGATNLFSGRVFIGLGALVLGILAVCGISAQPLYLVGLLVIGAGLLLGGSSFAARTMAAR